MVKIKCGLWNNFSILSTYQQNFFSSAMVKIKCGFWNKCQHINESLPHQPWWRRNDHHHHDYHRDFANSYYILLVMIINMYIKCHYHRFTDHDNHRDFANNNQKWPAGKGFEPHCRQWQSTITIIIIIAIILIRFMMMKKITMMRKVSSLFRRENEGTQIKGWKHVNRRITTQQSQPQAKPNYDD